MYILAIETTGPFGSVSLINENREPLAYEVTTEEMSHMKNLIPMCDAVISKAGIEKKDLTHIACSVGPGSFTGVRVGVSTARALSQVLNLPAIPVGTLDAFKKKECDSRFIAVILNARRGQVYGMIYDLEKEEYLLGPSACMLIDILNCINDRGISKDVTLFGDGIDAYFEKELPKEALGMTEDEYQLFNNLKNIHLASKENRYQDANSVAKLATELRECKYFELLPEYMRQAEAERKLEAGELNIKSMKIE